MTRRPSPAETAERPGTPPVDVLAVGEAMAVLCPDPPVPLERATTLAMSTAGAEANVVTHLARLGLRTVFATRVGDDPFGRLIAARLAEAGVGTAVEIVPDRPTGVYFKNPGAAGTRVHYYRAGSAASTMDPTVWASLPPARLVHLTGITPALSAACAALVDARLAGARPAGDRLEGSAPPGLGAPVSFDVNYRPALWPVEVAGPALAGYANRAAIVFVGLDEAATLWGTTTPDQVRELIDRPSELVVKDGAVGATAFDAAGACFVPAEPVEVVEPVGAGDAFAAGYLYGMLTGRPTADRLRLGHRLAAAALATPADVGAAVTLDDLHARERIHT